MGDDFSLTHLHSLRHPTEEGEISPEIEIYKFAHKVPRLPWTSPSPTNVPFGKVHSIIDGLNSEKSKGQQERKSTQNID